MQETNLLKIIKFNSEYDNTDKELLLALPLK